ncbi:MAG: tetratricopeptide repeat protein, partial [Planctomycetota bacterium]
HFADLAGFLGSRDRQDDVPALLERATGAAAGNAGRLEDLSGLWREHGDLRRARVAIEAALDLKQGDPHLLHRLADLLIADGEIERATDTLHLVINLARESNLRRTAVDRLLRVFYRADRTDDLIALEEAAIEGGAREVAPYLVLGKAWMRRREPDRAIHYLELLLEIDVESEDARLSLARLYEQQGDWDVALEQYTALMETHPQSRRKYLQAVAKIHLSRYDQDAAFACYEEILAGAPDNPAAFIEVGEAYLRLGLMDESSECLRQALRLKPDDTRTRLKLADLYRQMGEVERAEHEILVAVDGTSDNLRETARKRYYELISDGGRVNEEIASLRTRIDENPYDVAAPLTLTDIYVRELEYELALDMLQKLLTYQPNEARLLRERARMLGLMDRWDEAILDYERLWKLPDADQNALALDIAAAALEQGDRERAAQVLSQVKDVQKVAGLYRRQEFWDEAIAVLELGLTRSPQDFRLLSSLSRLHASRGDEDSAIEVLERALALRGDSWKLILRLGQLYHDVGRREDAIELGQQLFALIRVEEEDDEEDEDEAKQVRNFSALRLSSARNRNRARVTEIQTYFRGKGLSSEFAEIGAKEVLLQPTNHDLFNIVLSALQREDGKGSEALELIEAVGAATIEKHRIPVGETERTWRRSLANSRVNIYRRDTPFAEEHATLLEEGLEGGRASPESLIELARIHSYLTHKAEMLAVLEQGVQLFPDSTNLLTGLAQSLAAEKRYADALPHF